MLFKSVQKTITLNNLTTHLIRNYHNANVEIDQKLEMYEDAFYFLSKKFYFLFKST